MASIHCQQIVPALPKYMINRQTRAGLGTGFVSFVAGEKGQRMMKLAGLVPATMQIRLIQITHKPLN
jgi:phosphate transport system substrate-binding protein